MDMRALGASGLKIAPLVLGGNVFGWTADKEMSFRLLDAFVAAGFNAIDTADTYMARIPGNQGGESETIIGEWLASRKNRESVVVITKVGLWEKHKGLAAKNIAEAVEDSLRRLRTDYIDLYFAHMDDPSVPLDETLGAFDALVKAGKARSIGASNYSGARLKEALQVSKAKGFAAYTALQPNYNLVDRKGFEEDLLPACLANGIGVIPYFALASGFLTGKYRSAAEIKGTAREQLLKNYFTPRGERILKALNEVASRRNAKASQIALAWLIAQKGITAPIASATKLAQLEEIVAAPRLKLDADDLATLDKASRPD